MRAWASGTGRLRRDPLQPHFGFHAGEGRVDPVLQFLRVETADRVLDHHQMRFKLPGLGLRHDKRLERLRGDHDARQTTLPDFYAVVETPR